MIKTTDEIAAMRESGRMLATVLDILRKKLAVGMTTKDLAEIAKLELRSLGGQPTFLGYYNFPDVICISLDDEVVHGIPSAKRVIQDGAVVGLDFGVTYNSMITDSAITVIAGKPLPKTQKLVEITEHSLLKGISAVTDGAHVGDVGNVIQTVLDAHHYGIVRDLVGHGVGHELHEKPDIPNYGPKGSGPILKSGMTIAIEPMATLGTHKVYTGEDRWTIHTADGSMAAHFEHSVLVSDDGAEILTML